MTIVLAFVLTNLMGKLPILAAAEGAPMDAGMSVDIAKSDQEIEAHYSKAHPEVQEYVRMTARSFGRSGLWYNEDAYAALSEEDREKRIEYLAKLLSEGEYGRHLCPGLAEAGSLKDDRLVPGLKKVAAYHMEDRDYDCRPKWMAIAALARITDQDFDKDKRAWVDWWESQGHDPVDPKYLESWKSVEE